jgi:hypothetical protein
MITGALLRASLRERRCLRCKVRLTPHEDLVCAKDFPALYGGPPSEDEARYLGYIRKCLPNKDFTVEDLPQGESDEFRRFLLRIVRSKVLIEEYLHLYVFLFWESLVWEDCEPIALEEKYYKCNPDGADTHFAKNLLPRISSEKGSIFDIAGIGQRLMYVCELKHGVLDDRGVGQTLRYFEHAATITELADHRCDVRGVVPVLIVADADTSQWLAFPRYFRELLRIYYFRTDECCLRLCDGKKRLRSLIRQRSRVVALGAPG